MLTLSSAIAAYGFVFGIIAFCYACFNLFICLACFKSLLLSYPSAKIYSTLVKYVLGTKFSHALNYIFLIYIAGTLVGYILVTNNLLLEVFLDMITKACNITSTSTIKFIKLASIIIIGTLSLPLTLQNKIPAIFSKISFITMGVIVYLILLMTIQTFYYYKDYQVKSGNKYSPFKYNKIDYFRFYGNFVYSFNVIGIFIILSQFIHDEKSIE